MSNLKTQPAEAVQDVMSTDPTCCGPDDSLSYAARQMLEADCGALPVVHDGRVVSMVTDRDLCMAACTQNRPPSELEVEVAMSRRLISCEPNEKLEAVLEAMRVHQVRRMPVIDADGQPLGMVTLNDLAQACQGNDDMNAHAQITQTLAAIAEPRWHEAH